MKGVCRKARKQQGIAIVEFTIVATLFFTLIFAIIEFGRLLLTWHTLNEISRRTARLACVCQVTDAEQADTLVAAVIDNVPLPNFTINNIKLNYLDATGTVVPGPLTDPNKFNQIAFVEAKIDNYQFDLIAPLDKLLEKVGITFLAPDFSTILPRESLGVTRTGFTDC